MVLFGTIPLDGVLCEFITYFFLLLHNINRIKQREWDGNSSSQLC